jgi:hypothetical protein
MGYDAVDVKIYACLSRHNSPKDAEHDALWEEVKKIIQCMVDDPRYRPIMLDFS